MHIDNSTLTAAPKRARRGPGARLRDALLDLAERKAAITAHDEKSWASITFAGTRHRLDLMFEGDEAIEAAEKLIVFLPEHEFAIPGQLVADAAVIAVDHRMLPDPRMEVSVELLLLEED